MRHFISFILIPLFLAGVAAVIIALGRGYRIDFTQKDLKPSGIIVATSEPDGAQVFIDGKFSAATNSNINLDPGWYTISIKKEGFQSWQKKVHVRAEGVVKTNAILFKTNPSLSPMINIDVADPMLSPDGTQMAYIATPSANPRAQSNATFPLSFDKPTLFLFDLTTRANPFNRNPRPAEISVQDLKLNWQTQAKSLTEIALLKMPKLFSETATASARIIGFSPDETKVLYEATDSATIAREIDPPLIGPESVPDVREITSGKIYVYDAKEDKNYEIMSAPVVSPTAGTKKPFLIKQNLAIEPTPTPVVYPQKENIGWFGNSLNLYLIEKNQISIMEYTGENKVIVYSGPFVDSFVFPHPDGKELVILTNLNPVASPNPSLYTVDVR